MQEGGKEQLDSKVEEQPLTEAQQLPLSLDGDQAKQQSKAIMPDPLSSLLNPTEDIRLRSNQILTLTSPPDDDATLNTCSDQEGDTKMHDKNENESSEKMSNNSAADIGASRTSSLLHREVSVSQDHVVCEDTLQQDGASTNATSSESFTPHTNLERDQNVRNLRTSGVIHVQGINARRDVSATLAQEPDVEEQYHQQENAAAASGRPDGIPTIPIVAVARDDLEKEAHELIISKAPVGEIFDAEDIRRKDRRRLVRITGSTVCILVIVIFVVVVGRPNNGSAFSTEEQERLQVAAGLLPLLQNVSMEVFGETDPSRLALSDTESPQYKAYEWMVADSELAKDVVLYGDDTNVTFSLLLEQYAMVSLYHSTAGEGWVSEGHSFFSTADTTCTWLKNNSQCSCSDDGRVIVLDVANINMTGTLPDELVFLEELEHFNASSNGIWGSLGPLWNEPLQSLDVRGNEFSRWDMPSNWSDIHDQFRYIDVANNDLYGTIPTEIFELSSLEILRLTGNGFIGTFPSLVGALTNLVVLELGNSSLTGSIPSQLSDCSSLEVVNLAGTVNITGTIPDDIWGLPKLMNLDLSSLQLIMELPGDLLAKTTSLEALVLKSCRLQGTIPTEIGLMNLKVLDLSENFVLTGTLPSEAGTMSRLQRLYISENFGITGTIPTEIGNIRKLQEFVFTGTAVGGQIPTEIGRLTDLIDFNGRGSQLESSIPTEIGLLTALRRWDQVFTSTGFGTIPTEVGLLTNLEKLAFPVNLDGTFPSQLSYLTDLLELILPEGRVKGSIPSTIGHLLKLSVLALPLQELTGSLPPTLGALTNMRTFEIMSNMITGTIPQSLKGWTKARWIAIQNTNLTGYAGLSLCETWNRRYHMLGDCDAFEDGCPCCTQCCAADGYRCSRNDKNGGSGGQSGDQGSQGRPHGA